MNGLNLRGAWVRLIPILIGAIVMAVYAARGCQEGPFGRSQLVSISPEEEYRLGAQAFREVLSQSDVVTRGPEVDAVQRIGDRLAKASADPEVQRAIGYEKALKFDWQFRVVRDKQVNAFCLPGGRVVVFTGILPVCRTEAGLATVMGHEIGHALARHGAERMAQTELVNIGQMSVGVAFGDSPEMQRAVMGAFGVGAQFGVLLPFGRSHESEADHIGIILMAAAGYDPREAAKFWVRMGKATEGAGRPPEFASTHPSHETRVRDLEKWTEEAMPFWERSQKQDSQKLLPGTK